MAENGALLDVRGVTIQYKTTEHRITATYRVDFQVFRSDRFILLGPSGCGKSTLLKAVGGYLNPVEGEIRLKGVPVTRPGPDRMMVFQEFDQLLPWKTVKENVVFALVSSGKLPAKAAEEKALEYIHKVNLTKFADSYPHTLCGGMKQRVAITRGMAMKPDVLLMGRAFCRARRADPAQDAGRIAAAVGRHALHRPVRHPFDPRGDHHRQPDPADVAAPGTGQGGAQQSAEEHHARRRGQRAGAKDPCDALRRARRE
jgi:ABC-type lipoprotein export system ATPase subunit